MDVCTTNEGKSMGNRGLLKFSKNVSSDEMHCGNNFLSEKIIRITFYHLMGEFDESFGHNKDERW